MGHRHTGFHCLLNNGDFFLRSFTFTKLLPQQNSSHLKISTSVRHISKPISYFKIHPLSGVSRGRFNISLKEIRHVLFIGCVIGSFIGIGCALAKYFRLKGF
ncbi:hypothetical protein DEO18_23270 [Escherichia coli]|nr:hypothetical protein DEO18_23270 [Escherichia coli]TJG53199.1 hypothetical protein C9177_24375 [Escherichia coli]